MKISENWLREWVNPPVSATALAEKLNMAGLECEAEPLSTDLPRGVVVGRILKAEPHPQADRLRVCEVDAGRDETVKIVCGAANARVGILVPAALPGARLPGGKEIGAAVLRGVESAGMLCSASELGLAEKSEGLLELDPDAYPGTPIEKHLALNDKLLNLELTPNRGDCLSIAGLAREVAALYSLPAKAPTIRPAVVSALPSTDGIVEDAVGCPHYGRHQAQPQGPHPGLDARAAAPLRHPRHPPGGGYHQLRAARTGPADARLRLRQAGGSGAHPPRPRRGETGPAQRADH
jgi:phenylalanyl-tRNA synthetase beta chain